MVMVMLLTSNGLLFGPSMLWPIWLMATGGFKMKSSKFLLFLLLFLLFLICFVLVWFGFGLSFTSCINLLI